ncbi:MAG: LCP family protein, partial [Actinomycetota bacterium]|nr:LCP family protein [Actinomycetota bacterium]
YRVYRSRRRLLDRLRPPGDLASLRRRARGEAPELAPARRRITPGRVARWLALAVLGWLLLSLVVFLLSAEVQRGVSPATERALDPSGTLLGGSTILILGSDQRPPGTKEPGAGGPSRADSILLMRVGLGEVRRLSILRDSYAQIPGDGTQKINAAYAIGGPALAVDTVEGFLGNGLRVNHLIEVSFADFPAFIDALGGIDVTLKRCIRSNSFSGQVLRLRAGEQHLSGKKALAFARVRKNRCAPNEDDRARAARQHQVLAAIQSRLFSPATFVRLPWVAWEAPRTIETDMGGPGLLALFVDVMTGGAGKERVMEPAADGPGGSLIVSPQERARAVRHLEGADR